MTKDKTKMDDVGDRKRLLSLAQITAIEREYGIKSDGLPLDRAGHAKRVFRLAEESGTPILLGTDGRWRIYNPASGRWMDEGMITRWNLSWYVVQVGDLMLHNAVELKAQLAILPDEPAYVDDLEKRKDIEELIKIYEREGKSLRNVPNPVRDACAIQATEERKHIVNLADFDNDRDRILVRNGVIDLRTGKLLPHGPQYKFTRWIDLDFDPTVTAPTFHQFIEYVLPDPDVREWVQRWAGYLLTGHTNEHKIAILLGSTGTGKSSLVKLLAHTMGSIVNHGYARKVPEGLFRKRMEHWGDLVRLVNARLAYDAEFEQDTVLNAERIRVLTGEDEIDGNEKYGKYKYFELFAKFMISTNTIPTMSGRDPADVREATMRRLMIVPMNRPLLDTYGGRYTADELPSFFEDLESEKAGVLTWAVAGAVRWYGMRLDVNIPPAIEAARTSYAKQSGIIVVDRVQAALDEAGFRLDPTLKTSFKVLMNTMPVGVTHKALASWLDRHGVVRKASSGAWRIGIGK